MTLIMMKDSISNEETRRKEHRTSNHSNALVVGDAHGRGQHNILMIGEIKEEDYSIEV